MSTNAPANTPRPPLTAGEILGVAHRDNSLWDSVRGAQMKAGMRPAWLTMSVALLYATCILAAFLDTPHIVALTLWFALLLAVSIGALYIVHKWQSSPHNERIAVHDMWMIAGAMSGPTLLWTIVPLALGDLAAQSQALLIYLVTGALIASTTLLFALPLVGLGQLLIFSAAVSISLLLNQDPIQALIIIGFCICMAATIYENARVFVSQKLDEFDLAEKNATITLLLKEYEDAHGDWLWQVDQRGRLIQASDRMAHLLRREQDDLIGRHFITLLAGDDEDTNKPAALKTLSHYLDAKRAFTNLVVPVTVGDKTRWWELSAQPVIDSNNRKSGFRGVASDITEARISEDKINRMARYDVLTGLPNRSLLLDGLEEALTRAHRLERSCALMFIDLDRFKSINDTLGHQIGDKLLCEVAARLGDIINDGHSIGRLGGDEFAVVVRKANDEAAVVQLAESIISHLSEPYVIEGHNLRIGTSIGIAYGPSDGATTYNLIRSADLALYHAKNAGRGVASRYLPQMHREAERRRQLETELRAALENGELSLAYQPIFSTASQQIEGFEALLRWSHPTLGEVPPEKFVPIAEEAGLISVIGEWVVHTACAEAARWPEEISLSINLSPLQFLNPHLITVILSSLSRNAIASERLEVEITEGVFLSENAHTIATLHQLESIGVKIVLDDFGTGYSSLGYLRKANFSKIKIDRSFVQGAGQNADDAIAIIRAIVALAQSLNMTTTAEGAENEVEYESIRALGCDQVQGFYFSHPMTAAQAFALVSDQDDEPSLRRTG